MLQRVLAEAVWMGGMMPANPWALTPLVWGHVSPYGAFELDMKQRLDLDILAGAWGRETLYGKLLFAGVCYPASRASKGLRRCRRSRPRGERSRVGQSAPAKPPTGTSAPRITCRQPRWPGCSMLPRPAGTGCATTFCC